MKTIKEQLDRLPFPYNYIATSNMALEMADVPCDSVHGAISMGVKEWRKTEYGHSFFHSLWMWSRYHLDGHTEPPTLPVKDFTITMEEWQ
jgi:hypothetical protein